MTNPAFAPNTPDARTLDPVSPDGLAAYRAALPEAQARWLDTTGFAAALGEVCVIPDADGRVARAAVGLGTERARRQVRFGLARAVAALPAGGVWRLGAGLSPDQAAEAALGWLLAGYRFDRYRPGAQPRDLSRLICPEGVDAPRLEAMAGAEFLTRDLINTPAADMGPDGIEQATRDLAARFGATVQSVVGDDLLTQNFPMIHAVGRASPRAPRLIDLRWGDGGPRVVLVGKGVAFDTGGLNIKPGTGMALMKKDMGGAATVLGLGQMIMQMGLPLRLRILIPAVENVISGNALKPKDILTSRKGLTVEVNDTDAEGRLILADALAYAGEEPCDLLVSMATLTGAARVAVGPDLAPYYTDDAALARAIDHGAAVGFDPVWRMPFHDPYDPVIEPGIADLDNAPGYGFAGSVTAALFLRRFASHPRYVHFDIYGHSPSDAPARPKGGVGQGARALFAALPAMVGL